mmetsp:Transcript_29101/g.83533  ORF Transcript_29101/g.83533 Transcript_29101/m.83533 type:complete len:648 (+) Transcript_29101:85-2028(+)
MADTLLGKAIDRELRERFLSQLQAALAEDWGHFRQSVDAAMRQQQQRQEQMLVDRFHRNPRAAAPIDFDLGGPAAMGISEEPGQSSPRDSPTPSSVASLMAPPEVEVRLRPRHRELTSNIALIQPPIAVAPLLQEKFAQVVPAEAVRGPPTDDKEAAISSLAALAPLDARLERIEFCLNSQRTVLESLRAGGLSMGAERSELAPRPSVRRSYYSDSVNSALPGKPGDMTSIPSGVLLHCSTSGDLDVADGRTSPATSFNNGTSAEALETKNMFKRLFYKHFEPYILWLQAYFFVNENAAWNLFDFALVVAAVVDELLAFVMGGGGKDVTFMRSMRIFRMAKILRGLRLMRFFAELRIILNSLLGSIFSLIWSCVMMAVIYYLFGLMFVLGSVEYLVFDAEATVEDQAEVKAAYGGISVAMMSLFKASFGGEDWGLYYDIARRTGQFEGILFIIFIALALVALMNILTGMFVDNAMKYAQPDREQVALEHQKQQQTDSAQLRQLFKEMTRSPDDDSNSRTLSKRRFLRALNRNGSIRAQLSMLGLELRDGATFFSLLSIASDRDEVDIETFVSGCLRLKGTPSSIDVHSILSRLHAVYTSVCKLSGEFEARFALLEDILDMRGTPLEDRSGEGTGQRAKVRDPSLMYL